MSSEELLDADHQRSTSSFRRLAQLLIALALIAVAMASAAGLYAWRFDPVKLGSVSEPEQATVELGLGAQRDTYRLPWKPDEEQYVTFSIVNRGRWAVTVEGVKAESIDTFFGILGADAYQVTTSGELGNDVSLPHRLQPGEELALDVAYLITTCGVIPTQAGFSDASIRSLPVRWHALGVGHVTELPTPIIRVTTPPGVDRDFEKACH